MLCFRIDLVLMLSYAYVASVNQAYIASVNQAYVASENQAILKLNFHSAIFVARATFLLFKLNSFLLCFIWKLRRQKKKVARATFYDKKT